ncbi:MAG: zinc ribbon domain-containing protein [Chloroflexota bacterium]|nr:zinc ribbon domain-containing protein [Chloroflexota bacterium]
MPIYEYSCSGCKHKFELMRPMSRAMETCPCPKCGRTAPRAVSRFCRTSGGTSPSASHSACSSCSSSSCSTCSH